jgi:hypothetical protein
MAKRLLLADLAVRPGPGVALATDVLDLLDGRINGCRRPYRATSHTDQYRHQANRGHPQEHTAPHIYRPDPAARTVNSHDGAPLRSPPRPKPPFDLSCAPLVHGKYRPPTSEVDWGSRERQADVRLLAGGGCQAEWSFERPKWVMNDLS